MRGITAGNDLAKSMDLANVRRARMAGPQLV